MKTMRYRIRVIALLLVVSFLGVMLWCAHDIWLPSGIFPEMSPEPVPSASAEPLPSETPSPSPAGPTPEPLFDTFGL